MGGRPQGKRPDGCLPGRSEHWKSSNRPQVKRAACARGFAGVCLFGWTHAPDPALRMAESLVRDQRNAEIHLFSDGAVPELSESKTKRCRWFIIASKFPKTRYHRARNVR